MGKKKFIDKKNSATYRLVFKESSSVPGGGDGSGGLGEGIDRVFVRVDGGDAHVPGFDPEGDEGEDEGRELGGRGVSENARLELLELGFPDDGYDYLQHLREVGPSGRVGNFVPTHHARLDPLRPDVKAYDASNVKVLSSAEGIGDDNSALYINRSSRRIRKPTSKVIDLEVAALLDIEEAASPLLGDELEDDFVAIANEGAEILACWESGSEKEDSKFCKHVKDKFAEMDEFDDEFEDDDEESDRPTRFLDEQFEPLALREYDDDDIGELDNDDISVQGPAHISKFNNVMSDFLINSMSVQDRYHTPAEVQNSILGKELDGNAEQAQSVEEEKVSDSFYVASLDKTRTRALAMRDQGSSSDESMELQVASDTDDEEGRWDCETIVSTYSNLDNHPAKICAFPGAPNKGMRSVEESKLMIRLRGKQQLPVDYLPKRNNLQNDERKKTSTQKQSSAAAELTIARRKGDETKEEKKARKAAVKEERRAARASKKDVKLMYKGESHRAQRTAASTGPATVHL